MPVARLQTSWTTLPGGFAAIVGLALGAACGSDSAPPGSAAPEPASAGAPATGGQPGTAGAPGAGGTSTAGAAGTAAGSPGTSATGGAAATGGTSAAGASGAGGDGSGGSEDAWLIELASDMQGTSEALPHGVPDSFGWGSAPRIGMGDDPGTWTAATAWGQVYESAEESPAFNVRVHIRNLRLLMLSTSSGSWIELQRSESVDGAAYIEDFHDDLNQPIDLRTEPEGGVSVRLIPDYNFHFWPTVPRASIDPTDVAGMLAMFEARLVLDDPSGVDDREVALIVASAGGDYWESVDAQWDQWTTNGDFAIGKFKYVHAEWRTFGGHTFDNPDDLSANPPPR